MFTAGCSPGWAVQRCRWRRWRSSSPLSSAGSASRTRGRFPPALQVSRLDGVARHPDGPRGLLRREAAWQNLLAMFWLVVALNLDAYYAESRFCTSGGRSARTALAAWGVSEARSERINMGAAIFAATVMVFYFSEVMDKLGRSASLDRTWTAVSRRRLGDRTRPTPARVCTRGGHVVMKPAVRKGLVVAALHVAIVASLGAKLLVDRATRPRVWARAAPVDPNLPIRGRYVRLRLEARRRIRRCRPDQWPLLGGVTLRAENERLVATPVSAPSAITARVIEHGGRACGVLERAAGVLHPRACGRPVATPGGRGAVGRGDAASRRASAADPARRQEGRPADPARGELMDNCGGARCLKPRTEAPASPPSTARHKRRRART